MEYFWKRDVPRFQTAATTTPIMELFATIVYGWTLKTADVAKSSVVDFAELPIKVYLFSVVTGKHHNTIHVNL